MSISSVDGDLIVDDAGQDRAEEGDLGRPVMIALDLAADPEGLEFGEDLVEPLAGDLHLIERLDGGEPRRGAVFGGHHGVPRRRFRPTSASAARAASPPLSPARGSARSMRLRLVFDGQNAIAERQLAGDREIDQRPRALARDDLEMIGLAANDAAERHRAVVRLADAAAASRAMASAIGISSAPGTPTTS